MAIKYITGNENLTTYLNIGDMIPCRYTAPQPGVSGIFSELGTSITNVIPISSSATPDGLFYLIFVGYTNDGKMKFIADRNVQHSISWDVLNNATFINGNSAFGDNLRYIWPSIDNNTALNYTYSSDYPINLVEFNSQLFAFWSEVFGTVVYGRCKKYDGTTWTTADNNTYLNYGGTKAVGTLTGIVFNSQLYVTFFESGYMRAKKYDGTNWVSADNNTALNYSNLGDYTAFPIVYNSQLFLGWSETNGSTYQIRAKKYDGTTWTTADNNTSLNYNTSANSIWSRLEVFNSQLYLAWIENSQIRVKKYGGTTWTTADNNTSLNYSVNASNSNLTIISFNSQLYLAWIENNQVRVKKYNGTTWTTADNNTSLNFNKNYNAKCPYFATFNSQLYLSWSESSGTYNQVRIKKYDGINWSFIDNNVGLNYINTNSSGYTAIYAYNSQLHIMWQEAGYVRMRKLIQSNVSLNRCNLYSRIPTGGVSSSDIDNEWDKVIVNSTLNNTITAGSNSIWNWNGIYSWTSTMSSVTIPNRVIRGNTTNSTSSNLTTNTTNATTGFRPVVLIETLYKFKYLLAANGNVYCINPDYYGGTIPSSLTIIGTYPPSENDYLTYGSDNLNGLTNRYELLAGLNATNIDILLYSTF